MASSLMSTPVAIAPRATRDSVSWPALHWSADRDAVGRGSAAADPPQVRRDHLAQLQIAARIDVAERGGADRPARLAQRGEPVPAGEARQIGHAGPEVDRELRRGADRRRRRLCVDRRDPRRRAATRDQVALGLASSSSSPARTSPPPAPPVRLARLAATHRRAATTTRPPRFSNQERERFGFVRASTRDIRWEHDVPDEAFMVLELVPGVLGGRGGVVRYRKEFEAV